MTNSGVATEIAPTRSGTKTQKLFQLILPPIKQWSMRRLIITIYTLGTVSGLLVAVLWYGGHVILSKGIPTRRDDKFAPKSDWGLVRADTFDPEKIGAGIE